MATTATPLRLWIALLLTALLTACGAGRSGESEGGKNETPETENTANRPLPPADAEMSTNEEGTAHVTLTGGQTVDADYACTAQIFPDKGLQITMDQRGVRAPQVQIRIDDYMAAGKYTASVIVRTHSESGPVQESSGSADVELRNQQTGEAQDHTLFAGTFQGLYTGGAGSGKISGRFERCVYPEIAN